MSTHPLPRRSLLVRNAFVATSLAAVLACSTSDGGSSGFNSDPANNGPGNDTGSGGFGKNDSNGGTDAGAGCTKMDIVFVIDDSGSMGEEQANLTANFPKFVSVLDSFGTSAGPLDYRVAVTTTGKSYREITPVFPLDQKGDDGKFRNNCGAGGRRWLERAEAATSFECRAKVGTKGPSKEMPLECLSLALTDRMKDGTNAGFLRPDALLAVVIITDEDDCSRKANEIPFGDNKCDESGGAEKLSTYLNMLDTVAGGRERWALALIAGKTQCESTFGTAREATRLASFVGSAPNNTIFSSICDGDLSGGLKAAIEKFGNACRALPPIR